LVSTLLTRLVAGPLCDRFGPRLTFIGILLAGSLPTVLAGGVVNKQGLLAIRFFLGVIGGSFVPCQVYVIPESLFEHLTNLPLLFKGGAQVKRAIYRSVANPLISSQGSLTRKLLEPAMQLLLA
jgi:MFS family permease